jgi:2-oxoglutarate ferredoxin oxidoreductase subunit delta
MAINIKHAHCKGCGICVAFCPQKILVLDELGVIKLVNPENCTQCLQCELRCPEFAVKIVKSEVEK